MLSLSAAIVLGYLLGALPVGLALGRLRAGVDLRDHGSGNVGGTNAARVLGWRVGLLVVALDVSKGWLATRVARALAGDGGALEVDTVALMGGVAAMLGHVLPLYTHFRGGKGVAPFAGVLLAVNPMTFAGFAGTFVVVLASSRIVSLASLTATAAVACGWLAGWLTGLAAATDQLVLVWAAAGIIVVAHRANLRRIRRGDEPALTRANRDPSGGRRA